MAALVAGEVGDAGCRAEEAERGGHCDGVGLRGDAG